MAQVTEAKIRYDNMRLPDPSFTDDITKCELRSALEWVDTYSNIQMEHQTLANRRYLNIVVDRSRVKAIDSNTYTSISSATSWNNRGVQESAWCDKSREQTKPDIHAVLQTAPDAQETPIIRNPCHRMDLSFRHILHSYVQHPASR